MIKLNSEKYEGRPTTEIYYLINIYPNPSHQRLFPPARLISGCSGYLTVTLLLKTDFLFQFIHLAVIFDVVCLTKLDVTSY